MRMIQSSHSQQDLPQIQDQEFQRFAYESSLVCKEWLRGNQAATRK